MRPIPIPCEPDDPRIFCPECGEEPEHLVYRRETDYEIVGCDCCISPVGREELLLGRDDMLEDF